MQPGVSSALPARDLVLASGHAGHHVQFYENDGTLVSAVAEFLASGLTIGQPVVVIATETHRAAFMQRLRDTGADPDAHVRNGRLVMIDARATLATFMMDGAPNATRFRAVIGDAIENARIRHDAPVVRMYGEMVSLLWSDGNPDGALHLEELWNDIASEYAFSLLCGYAMASFDLADAAPRFVEICRQHTHVIDEARLVERGLLPHGYEHVALAPLVAEAMSQLDPLIIANRLTCDLTSGSGPSPIIAYCNRAHTREIVISLLTNAIKFTPAGGRLVVELSAGAISPNTVRVRVTDTGIGIATPQLDRIFDHVGLGLTTSRDLARAMGGDLTVSSALGVGTTISLVLPATATDH